MADISLLGNLRLAGALQLDKNYSEFPSNPKIGTLVIKDQCLYGYIKIGTLETWYPFASKTSSYIHSQAIASLTWTVNHNLGSTDIWHQIKNQNGVLVSPAGVEILSPNTIQFTFTEAITGTAILVSTSSIDVPSLRTTELQIGSNVILTNEGIKINGENVLTHASVSISDGFSKKFTFTDNENLSFIQGNGVTIDFNATNKSVTISAPGAGVSESFILTKISELKGSVPSSLNTLEKIAYAIGNDASFAETTNTKIDSKLERSEVTTVSTPNKILRVNSDGTIHANITGNISGSAASANSVDWQGVSGTPTSLNGYGIVDAFPINGKETGSVSLPVVNLYGGILPSVNESFDLGSNTKSFGYGYFSSIRIKNIEVGTSTNISESSNSLNISSGNKSLNISSTGSGKSVITSQEEVEINSTKDVKINGVNLIVNGNSTINGNQTVTSDLTISGNLTVLGTKTEVNSTTVTTRDNLITVNKGEVGNGVTSILAGLEVDRGSAATYQIVFDEVDDLFKVGEAGDLEIIASRPWVSNGFSSILHGHSPASSSTDGFLTSSDFIKLSTVESYANFYQHPTTDGNKHLPANGTTNSGKFLLSGSNAGESSWAFIQWSDIKDKPLSFTPSAHVHTEGDLGSINFNKLYNVPTTISGYGISDAVHSSDVSTSAVANKLLKLNSNGVLPASITGNAGGNAASATSLETARTFAIYGDGTGSASFNGTSNCNINFSLNSSPITPNTYATKVMFNSKGIAIGSTALAVSDIPDLSSVYSKLTALQLAFLASASSTTDIILDANTDF